MTKLALLGSSLVVVFVVSSCGSSGSATFDPSGTSGGNPPNNGGTSGPNGSNTSNGSNPLGGSTPTCGAGNATEGCACEPANSPGACWTGPAADRHRGACKDGTAACVKKGEFFEWGPCEGEVLDCGNAPPPDAGQPVSTVDSGSPAKAFDSGGAPTSTTGCAQTICPCVPGSVIGCDEDCAGGVYCSSTGQKSCLPDGTWGACKEVPNGQPTSCRVIGTGCTASESCNSGQGVFMGDCASVFTCAVKAVNGNTCARGLNGVWTVACTCDGSQASCN